MKLKRSAFGALLVTVLVALSAPASAQWMPFDQSLKMTATGNHPSRHQIHDAELAAVQAVHDALVDRALRGQHVWKMPKDVELDVVPTVKAPLSKSYLEATEKYGSQVQAVQLPNGRYDIKNYHGGIPFPNPQEPLKGWKISANTWFAYVPSLYFNGPQNPLQSCTEDRFGSITCSEVGIVYTQTGYNTNPGIPYWSNVVPDFWFDEYVEVYTPEESKYTALLQMQPKDNQLYPYAYAFVPALRRSLRLSSAARCAPVVGSDFTQDDYKTTGSNGGIAVFQAQYLAHRKILAMADTTEASGAKASRPLGVFPANYYMPLGLLKPPYAKWQLRDVEIIDLRRIPSEAEGYCYGKKIEYVDTDYWYSDLIEDCNANMKPWKIVLGQPYVHNIPGVGLTMTNDCGASSGWDIQNDHGSFTNCASAQGIPPTFNSDVPAQYHDLVRYGTPGGLMQIGQ